MFDLVVVGAGPAGLELARSCSGSMDVVVLEEHKKTGKPNHCSGLVSKNIDLLEKPQPDCIEHKVSGAVLHSPGGGSIVLRKHGFAAYVIDREKFDARLAEQTGCDVLTGSRLDSLEFEMDYVSLKAGKRQFKARVVAGADGSGSFVGGILGARPKELVPGIISATKQANNSEFVELWFDKSLTDSFLWKIPRGEMTEYGMWGRGSSYAVLKKFFKIAGKEERHAGAIPLGPPKTYFDRAILVGDAAAQTKPWSGGGVVYGMACARIAAGALKKASDFSEGSLRAYEAGWKRMLGKSIAAGMFMRRIYAKAGNSQIDGLMHAAGHFRLLNRIDMDFIGGTGRRLKDIARPY